MIDPATLLGIAAAVISIGGGYMLEGGHLSAILQPTAALIVGGGTLAAIFVQFRWQELLLTARSLGRVFVPEQEDFLALSEQFVRFSEKARREGLVALESEATLTDDPFLSKALNLAVDGTHADFIRDTLTLDQGAADDQGETTIEILEAAGGYSPTIGIIGAVLGLIHVMENLSSPELLGQGIAVAFVATIYGVALANLFLLPMAGKLRGQHELMMQRYDLIIEGVIALVNGDNPRLMEQKLRGYLPAGTRDDTF